MCGGGGEGSDRSRPFEEDTQGGRGNKIGKVDKDERLWSRGLKASYQTG